jgi:group I intron endonuclease
MLNFVTNNETMRGANLPPFLTENPNMRGIKVMAKFSIKENGCQSQSVAPMIMDCREPKRKKRSGIYKITCKPTGKKYVGSAVWVAKRKRHHREALLSGTHHNCYLQRAWNKYGPDAFEFVILEYCEKENLTNREQHYIDFFKAFDRKYGFNLQPKAYSNLGMVMPSEAKKKLSDLKKGGNCTLSSTQIEELRERMKGNTFRLGKPHTEATKKRLRIARQGRTPSLGMTHSKESRLKMSKALKGRSLSDKNKAGISRALKGRKLSHEHNWNAHIAQSKIKPEQFDIIRSRYAKGDVLMRELAAEYGCCTQTISNVVNGKRMRRP